MKTYFGSKSIGTALKNSVVALGNFDGVHLGHQYLLSCTRKLAQDKKTKSVVYTFDPHPVSILAPQACPQLLQTIEQKVSSIEKLDIDLCVVEKFSHKFSKQTPTDFFNNILINKLGAQSIVVGYDFTFGFHRSGTIETLERLALENTIDVVVIEAQFLGDLLLSSSEIRHFVSTGRVDIAKNMLGRPYSIEGTVVAGKGLGGSLGAHTANIKPINELIPENGIYLTTTYIDNNVGISSITSIGNNPTFPGEPLSIETHLLNFKKNIIGKNLKIDFHIKKRNQIAFDSIEKLQLQIKKDLEEAIAWHETNRTL